MCIASRSTPFAVLLITQCSRVLTSLTSNMKVSTSSRISSSVRGSPSCDVWSSKSRKFTNRFLPVMKKCSLWAKLPFRYAWVCRCVCECVFVCVWVCGVSALVCKKDSTWCSSKWQILFIRQIYMYKHMVTTLSRPVVTLCTTSFQVQKFCPLPTGSIHVFCVDLRINSDYLPIQH